MLTTPLDCPFCGGMGGVVPYDRDHNHTDPAHAYYWIAGCLDAQCPMYPCVARDTREDALAAWNTRPPRRLARVG